MNFFSRMSLLKKMTVLSLTSLLLVGGLFSLVALQAIQESTRRDMEDRLVTAQVVSAYMDQVLIRTIDTVRNVVEEFENTPNLDSPDARQKLLKEIFSHLEPSASRISLHDRTGDVLGFYPDSADEPSLEPGRYLSIGKNDQPSIAVVRGSQLGLNATISIAIPFPGRPGSEYRIVNALIDLSSPDLFGFLQPIKLGKTGYAQIVDQEGKVIGSTNKEASLEETIHPERFAVLIRDANATVVTCHRCHIPDESAPKGTDVVAFAPLASAPWGVAIRQSEEEVFALTRGLESRMMLYGVLSFLVVLLMAWIMANNILRPINSLTLAARRIGRGDLSGIVTSSAQDEIGALANAFNTMTTDLRRSRADLEASNQLLREQAEILASLLKVAEEIGRETDLEELFSTLVQIIPGLVSCTRCYTFLWDRVGEVFLPEKVWGINVDLIPSFQNLRIAPEITPLFQDAINKKTPVLGSTTNDVSNIPLDFRTLFGTTSMLVAPLILKEKLLGAIVVDYTGHTHQITAKDLAIIHGVASQVSLVVENAELLTEASKVEALRELSRLKSEFVARASHELRTPLTSIKGFAETLLRRDILISEGIRQEFLESINEMSDHMINLINSLLNLARLEEGTLELNIIPVQLKPLLEKAVERFMVPNTQHTFNIVMASLNITVMADHNRLDDVLTNLISNAVRYSPNGGQVTINARISDVDAQISVIDEGIGIPADKLDQIFRRFQRIDSVVSRQVGGAGLGLSICRGYVEALGGRIWVESVEGKGSTFSFTIPMAIGQDSQTSLQQSAQV